MTAAVATGANEAATAEHRTPNRSWAKLKSNKRRPVRFRHRLFLRCRRGAGAGPADRRPCRDGLGRGASAALGRALARNRRNRPGRAVAADLGGTGLPAGRRRFRDDLNRRRRARRTCRRLFRRLGRPDHLAHHRCAAGDAVSDPRHRTRRLSRAKPWQRHDRHRGLGHADIHPPHTRPGAEHQNGRLCRGRACHWIDPISASSPAISCRMCSRQFWCNRRSASPWRSSPRPASVFSVSASNRPPRAGGRC